MAEWITCAACGLKHSKRLDGICPRCKRPLDEVPATDEVAEPVAATSAPASAAQFGSLSQAARGKELKSARGILLVVGGLSLLVNLFVFGTAAKTVDDAIRA